MLKQKSRQSERITFLQSQKTLVQVLNLSFSCIAFLRGFFDDNHFEDSVFVNGETEQGDDNGMKSSLKMKIIKKGCSSEADGLLDWINSAISDSLGKKFLKGINLSILLDPEKPLEIFETYCFKVCYSESGPSVVFDTDVKVSPLENTRRQIQQLLKRFIVITQSLPNLPAKRYLSMQLLFNKTCTESYCPQKFVDCSNERPAVLKIPVDYIDDVDIMDCGEMDTPHHQLCTKIISLASIDPETYAKAKKFKDIDPFDLLEDATLVEEDEKKDEEQKDDSTLDEEMSQITKELKSFVHDDNETTLNGSEDTQKFQETQVASQRNEDGLINCHCESSKPLSYSAAIQCSECNVYFHRVCYAVHKDDNTFVKDFLCLRCKGEIITDDLRIIFNIRKIITWLNTMEKPNLLSIKNVMEHLGYNLCNRGRYAKPLTLNTKFVTNSLSVLLYDGILTLKARKSFFYVPFDVDCNGLLMNNVIVTKGKYFINYSRNNNDIDKYFYSNLGIISKQIDDSMRSIVVSNINEDPDEHQNNSNDFENEINKYVDFDGFGVPTNQKPSSKVIKRRKVTKSVNIFAV